MGPLWGRGQRMAESAGPYWRVGRRTTEHVGLLRRTDQRPAVQAGYRTQLRDRFRDCKAVVRHWVQAALTHDWVQVAGAWDRARATGAQDQAQATRILDCSPVAGGLGVYTGAADSVLGQALAGAALSGFSWGHLGFVPSAEQVGYGTELRDRFSDQLRRLTGPDSQGWIAGPGSGHLSMGPGLGGRSAGLESSGRRSGRWTGLPTQVSAGDIWDPSLRMGFLKHWLRTARWKADKPGPYLLESRL